MLKTFENTHGGAHFRQRRKAATVCALEKKGVLKNSSSESCLVHSQRKHLRNTYEEVYLQ